MIIQLEQNIKEIDLSTLITKCEQFGFAPNIVKTHNQSYLVVTGKGNCDIRELGGLPGVLDIHVVKASAKLVSREWKTKRTVVKVGDALLGDGHFQLMAGPCSLESKEQIELITDLLAENKLQVLRGGAFKPRTSPYSFRGLGIEGLKMAYEIAHSKNISLVSEVTEASQIQAMYPFIDMYQVGTRNSQNFALLLELGKIDKPILLKRGMSGTLDELLQSAEYIFSEGNEQIVLCERGIRTYESAYRNTLDINAIPVLKDKTHLPVTIDPSHGIGIRKYVNQVALAGVVAGADGVLVEIHPNPDKSVSDADQTIGFDQFIELQKSIKKVTMD
jgi:3-deoxy-7-phosphoheptulonate synthase